MDELVHHCLRELSFDGDFGCSVSRLRDFIVDFYARSHHAQNADDSFCTFVWSLIVQQPTVLVGIKPQGVTSEVWLAPQQKAVRKAKAEGGELTAPSILRLDLVEDARTRSLNDLIQQYGSDDLRIALEPDAIYAAITGTHIRFPKLSPMVYTALQIITRGRESGVTVVQLGKQSGYDQKTCFYLVKQLTDLDLVVKVRRGGVGSHFCIHKYFFERSPVWAAIRAEEGQAEDDDDTAAQEPEAEIQEEDENQPVPPTVDELKFTPIDARHLSSLPLVKARVLRLLKASKNHIHASNNMVKRIGFSNPTKTDRRFFQARIRELLAQNLIEQVLVPTKTRGSQPTTISCFRLVEKSEGPPTASTAPAAPAPEDIVAPGEVEGAKDAEGDDDRPAILYNITIHKQISDLLESSGTSGMTLQEITSSLLHFDKRTIELVLARAEKVRPPAHLGDLATIALMETSGRERRNRYYTLAGYRALVKKEGLGDGGEGEEGGELERAGDFYEVDRGLFYDDEATLKKHQDGYKRFGSTASKRTAAGGNSGLKEKTPRLNTPKPGKKSNPIMPDGTVKKGRPRKQPFDEDGNVVFGRKPKTGKSGGGRKRKREEGDEGGGEGDKEEKPPPKKKGRPKKADTEQPADGDTPPAAPKKGKGKKGGKKDGADVEARPSSSNPVNEITELETTQLPRKRARVIRNGAPRDQDNVIPPNGLADSPALVVEDPDTTMDVLDEEPPTDEPPSKRPRRSSSKDTVQVSTSVVAAQSCPKPSSQSQDAPIDFISQYPPSIPSDSPAIEQKVSRDALQTMMEGMIPIDPALLQQDAERQVSASVPPDATSTPTDGFLQPIPPANSPPITEQISAKRKRKGAATSKVNVSHLRRENEFLRVVEEAGGIIAILSREMADAHATLLASLATAGEPTSAPVGTKTDKRTVTASFNNLADRGKVKLLKTVVAAHTGATRPVVIAYLPELPQEKVNAYLAELGRTAALPPSSQQVGKKLAENVEFSVGDERGRDQNTFRIHYLKSVGETDDESGDKKMKDPELASRLFSSEEEHVRDVLLTDRAIYSQLYGYIPGRPLRGRALHLLVLKACEEVFASPNIISHSQRIIHLSYFFNDLTLGQFCSVIAPLSADDVLTDYFFGQNGKDIQLKNTPMNIRDLLQVGRSRSRARMLEIMLLLVTLGVVIPLSPSSAVNPLLTCAPNGDHPTSFQQATEEWIKGNTVVPTSSPTYWHFPTNLPVHYWASTEDQPPLWKSLPASTMAEAEEFWGQLHDACRVRDMKIASQDSADARQTPLDQTFRASLRRRSAWDAEYAFSWHQEQFMNRHIDSNGAETPLEDEEYGEERMKRIAWIISAPETAVRDYYTRSRQTLLREVQRARKAERRRRLAKETEEAKATLAKKAAEAREERTQHWDRLLQKVHPEPPTSIAQVRLKRIRTKFMSQSLANDDERWEEEIARAFKEAETASQKVLKLKSGRSKRTLTALPVSVVPPAAPALPSQPASQPVQPVLSPTELSSMALKMPIRGSQPDYAPPLASNPPERDLVELIDAQGPPIPISDKPRYKHTKKRGQPAPEKPKKEGPLKRRPKFAWSPDYDEVLRDASAIIRSRCRTHSRVDWGGFTQVFPAIPRNTCRQRLAILREAAAEEPYLNRLEDRWHDLWLKYRGTKFLPDEHVQSATNFDLIAHIEFLRKHIDKNALRVGLPQPQDINDTVLPASLDHLFDKYQIVETQPQTTPRWDFMWSNPQDEVREHRALEIPANTDSGAEIKEDDVPTFIEIDLLAEAAVKMTFGAPDNSYTPDRGAMILNSVGEDIVSSATRNLLNKGVLSKAVRDPSKPAPGRQLKIAEANSQAIGGSLPREMFQDAVSYDESAFGTEWRDWSLLAADGDTAALLDLISQEKVEFAIDTSLCCERRESVDWSSKKADDDDNEATIQVRFLRNPPAQPSIDAQDAQDAEHAEELEDSMDESPDGLHHGVTVDENAAACLRQNGDSIIDCSGCLASEWQELLKSLDKESAELVENILSLVRGAGADGLVLEGILGSQNSSKDQVLAAIRLLTERSVPLICAVGYTSRMFVSSAHVGKWSVIISNDPIRRVFPRRWLDAQGNVIKSVWDGGLRAIMGVVVVRPGISQSELRWRLRSIYDRQELNDLLQYLLSQRVLRFSGEYIEGLMLGNNEEKSVTIHLGEREWYRV